VGEITTPKLAIEQDAKVEGGTFGGNAGIQAMIGVGVDAFEGERLGQQAKDGVHHLTGSGMAAAQERVSRRRRGDDKSLAGIKLALRQARGTKATIGQVRLAGGLSDC
jgi:hypothetical protein